MDEEGAMLAFIEELVTNRDNRMESPTSRGGLRTVSI